MNFALYAEINIFCILILFIIFYRIINGIDKQTEQKYFAIVLMSEVVLFLLDLLWVMVEHNFIPIPIRISRQINFALNCTYFIHTGTCAFTWLIYSENGLGNNIPRSRPKFLISLIPLVTLAVLSVTSYWTGLLFYVDENNHYSRGPLYFIQVILAYGYLVFAAVRAFRKGRQKDNFADRKRYFTLCSFVFLPIIFGVLQSLSNSMPLVCVGITLSIINIYIDSQEQLISIDNLTQINNRNQLFRYLSGKVKQNNSFYLVMMDVDGFKKINDKFGHLEGDAALKKIATALKKLAAKKNFFVSRYGGDEFILIGEMSDDDIELISGLINQFILVENAGDEYKLQLSVGYSEFTNKSISIQELIENADQMLYKVKQEKKAAR